MELKFGKLDMSRLSRDTTDDRQLFTLGAVCGIDGVLRKLPGMRRAGSLPQGMVPLAAHRPVEGVEVWVCALEAKNGATEIYSVESDLRKMPLLVASIDARVEGCSTSGAMAVVAATDGLHYLYWKDGAYRNLGMTLPRLNAVFRLVAESINAPAAELKISLGDASTAELLKSRLGADGTLMMSTAGVTANVCAELTAQVYSAISKIEAERITRYSRFGRPFFARAAIRLVDGTIAGHTPVALMTPSGFNPPSVGIEGLRIDSDTLELKGMLTFASMPRCRLEMKLVGTDMAQWDLWSDIVEGIEIGVTDEVDIFDRSEMVAGFASRAHILGCDSADRPGASGSVTDGQAGEIFAGCYSDNSGSIPAYHYETGADLSKIVCAIPSRNRRDIVDEIVSMSTFRRIAELKLSEMDRFVGDYFELDEFLTQSGRVDDSNGRILTDGCGAYDRWVVASGKPKCGAPMLYFNGRLTVAPRGVVPGAPSDVRCYVGEHSGDSAEPLEWEMVKVGVRREGVLVEVVTAASSEPRPVVVGRPMWFFHPDSGAESVSIIARNGKGERFEWRSPLTHHDRLSGAYCFDPDAGREWRPYDGPTTGDGDPAVRVAPSLLWSGVDTPFLFTAATRLRLPCGEVVALRPATLPMSEGQFGRYPLYFFSREGMGVVDSDSTGGWSEPRALAPDSVESAQSVAAMGNKGVVFAGSRGVMLVSGSRVVKLDRCMGDSANPRDVRWLAKNLPYAEMLVSKETACDLTAAIDAAVFDVDIAKKVVYDSVSDLLYVSAFDSPVAYGAVYSPVTDSWGITPMGDGGWWRHIVGNDGRVRFVGVDGSVDILDWQVQNPLATISGCYSFNDRGRVALRRYDLKVDGQEMWPGGAEAVAVYGSNDGSRWFPVVVARGRRSGKLCGSGFRHFVFMVFSPEEPPRRLLLEMSS